ncbi:MAG: hypothetical protein QXZ06_00850, partial [Candidatus Jordarchaeales archaeon]
DGGWNRVVWMPSYVKERVLDAIPENLRDKIATEKDVSSTAELKEFLKAKGHPVVEHWKAVEAPAAAEATAEGEAEMTVPELAIPVEGVPAIGGGIQLIFKNVKIRADKLIIKRVEKSKK